MVPRLPQAATTWVAEEAVSRIVASLSGPTGSPTLLRVAGRLARTANRLTTVEDPWPQAFEKLTTLAIVLSSTPAVAVDGLSIIQHTAGRVVSHALDNR